MRPTFVMLVASPNLVPSAVVPSRKLSDETTEILSAQLGEVVESADSRILLDGFVGVLYNLRGDDACQELKPYLDACELLNIDPRYWRQVEFIEAANVISALRPLMEQHVGAGARFGKKDPQSNAWGYWPMEA